MTRTLRCDHSSCIILSVNYLPKALHDALQFPDTLKTPEDAKRLLTLARAVKQEQSARKSAAKHALRGDRIRLELDQEELERAMRDLANANDNIGAIRALIRKKGFPITFELPQGCSEYNFNDESMPSESDNSGESDVEHSE